MRELDLSRDTVLVLSDHGHIRIGGHGGQDADVLIQPLVLAGKGVRSGAYGDINQVDVAPTIAALLGAAVPSSSQGQVRVEMLTLPAETQAQIKAYSNKQLTGVVNAYSSAILGREPDFPSGELTAEKAKEIFNAIRLEKLGPERSLRSAISLILVVTLLVVIILKWRKEFTWFFAGAFLLLFLFNLRYSWIDGRTYSLSSVQSEMDMILYVGITAAIAFAICLAGRHAHHEIVQERCIGGGIEFHPVHSFLSFCLVHSHPGQFWHQWLESNLDSARFPDPIPGIDGGDHRHFYRPHRYGPDWNSCLHRLAD